MTDWQRMRWAGVDTWKNDTYTADCSRYADGSVFGLRIRRRDGQPVHDWRDLMRVKNDVAGDEIEAVEVYPAMSRLMDEANAYFLFCYPPGVQATMLGMLIGYPARAVSDGPNQRPVPDDWKDS